MIRFTSTNGIGTVLGARLYEGSNWWSTGGPNDPSSVVVVFWGDQLVRGTAGFWDGMRPKGGPLVLLVGVGSGLYYGDDQRWRDDHSLLTAGERFWRSTPGCHSLL
ncbi:hypothetical protein [Vulcanococcus limneticus]|uniref:hypothetical protein n=1 Tax=Vulcanococcus limneticus TaxID=2170428 RepID=UPI00398BD408